MITYVTHVILIELICSLLILHVIEVSKVGPILIVDIIKTVIFYLCDSTDKG